MRVVVIVVGFSPPPSQTTDARAATSAPFVAKLMLPAQLWRRDSAREVLPVLISACELGDVEIVSSLLGLHGEPPRLKLPEDACMPDPRADSSTYGLSALHCCRSVEVATLLLDAGVPVDVRGPLGQTPLHTCCEYTDVVKLLLSRGADPNVQTEDGSTALEWAVVADSLDTLKVLVAAGGDCNLPNDNGNTCLHLACSTCVLERGPARGGRVLTVRGRQSDCGIPAGARRARVGRE
jgi:hypothetical protein